MAEDVIEAPEIVAEPEPATDPAVVEEVTATEDKPEKTFTQAELDEIVQKRINKLERKMERQRIESETRAQVLNEVQSKPEAAANKPKIEDFGDYADFQEALTDWKVDEKLRQLENQKTQSEARKTQESETQRTNERQAELIESGERKYEDFEEVVKSDKNSYSRAAYLAILESDQSADIVYHLAKNQEEAKRIAALPAYAQAKEIGKLEDRLSATKPVKASNAPKPVDPIGSGQANTKSIDNMSQDEYNAYRLKQKPVWGR